MNSKAWLCLTLVGFAGLARAGTPALPNIPAYTADVTQAPYNALGNGTTINTTAIQTAINDVNARGGGTVEIPGPGVYLSGPLTLKNNLNLQIDASAILRMLPYDRYPGGITNPPDFITGSSLHDIEISGSGAIDGQGAPWWPGYKTNNRPTMVYFGSCSKVLIQNTTFSNSPAQFIGIKGNNAGNVTIQGITVKAPPSTGVTYPSHNTDALDLAETNALIQSCFLDTGDDNIAIGSSAGLSRDILVTNCFFGEGHGCSIGSYTSSGVSNLTVINCTFSNTDNGIRIKSDNDRGGTVQNLNYLNLTMTNVAFPFCIYAYYNSVGTPSSVSPYQAATQTVASVTSKTPIYRNLTFSNITAYSVSGYPVGLVWARTEMPATNLVFNKVNLTGDRNFCLYNVSGAQFIDCDINTSAKTNTFALFNTQVTITNSAPTNNLFTFDGLTTNGYGNSLRFYNALGSLKNTNVFDDGPLTLSASTLTVSNNLTLFPTTVLNYILGTNTTKLAVVGNLMLGGTNNLSAGPGFTNGTYTLITYTGNLNGSGPTLGTTPGGAYTYALDTNTAHQVNLLVNSPSPPVITKQPASQAVLAGSSVLFTVGVAGSSPLSYQWWFNSTNRLAAGTNSSLTISNAQPANTGSYSVVVTNALGAAVSSNALLAIVELEAWGDNTWNQLDVPAQARDVIAIAAGAWHNLALQADGTVLAWGNDLSGQCDVPATLLGALAIAAGGYHSLAIRADGTVVAWGANDDAQTNVPARLANVIGISAGTWHSLALCHDGTVAAWGDNTWGQSSVPAGLSNVVAIAAGGNHSLALQTNGLVVAWGENTDAEGNYAGQSVVPANLADVVAIAAGEYHSLAVRSDGTIVAWGDNSAGQSSVPVGLSNVVAVAGGGAHSLALTADGGVAAWGSNWNGQCNVPTGLSDVVGIGAGEDHSVALLAGTLPVPQLLSPALQGAGFSVLVQTLNRKNYALEFKSPITTTNWSAITTNTGNGSLRQLTDPAAPPSLRFYRVVCLP